MGLLPKDIENLKCKLCKNYLSVLPITVISADGQDYKCGRCDGIKTEVNIRMQMLEDVLKLAEFPCIYKNCEEKLQLGAVEAHEQVCPHKTFTCNMLEDCSDVIAIDEFEAHYIARKHGPDYIFHEKFEKAAPMINHTDVCLFIRNRVPYLVYQNRNKFDLRISVFSLKSKPNETTKYEVKLSTETSGISVLYENETVVPYNEREHCARCLINKCLLPYHKFSEANKGDAVMINHIPTTRINTSWATITLGSDKFVIFVTILDEHQPPEISQPDELVKAKEQEPSGRSTICNNKLLREILQCPICMEFMSAEIYTCNTGHAICKTCRPQMKACPTCGKGYAGTRNYSLEEIAENVELACQNEGRGGCNFIGNVANIHKHQAQCPVKSPKPVIPFTATGTHGNLPVKTLARRRRKLRQ